MDTKDLPTVDVRDPLKSGSLFKGLDKKDLARIQRDVNRADRRVGDRAKWLFDFAYRDLSKLDKQGGIQIGLEILAVCLAEDKEIPSFFKRDSLRLRYCFNFLTANGLWLIERGSFVDLFQSEIRKRFDDCKLGRWWVYQPVAPVERFTVFRVKSPEGFYGDYSKQTNENGLDYLLRITTEIVRRERERFAICQNRRCEKAFVGERKNRSKYCSPKCSAYVRVNKRRGKL